MVEALSQQLGVNQDLLTLNEKNALDEQGYLIMKDLKADHPDQQIFVAPAGTVVVFNSHVWHGGTLNRTIKPRRAVHAYYCRREQKQQLNQRHHLSPATVGSFPPEIRCLLDIE